MAELARGYSFVMYTAEAGASYTIPFPYLHQEDILVFAGDTGDAVEEPYTWLGPSEIQLAAEVPEGILVTIRRFTKRDDVLVRVSDGSQLPARDLNLNAAQLLYIIQEQIDFGTYGGSGLPGGGVGWPSPGGGDPPLEIQEIIDAVMQSPTMQLLIDRIEPIDSTAETLMEELIRSDQFFDARRSLDKRVAFVETDVIELQDDTKSLAQQTTELFAQFDSAASQILDVKQALADETEARATAVEQLHSEFQEGDEEVTKAITETLETTYATKDYAESTAQTQVEAWAKGDFAMLQERFDALVDGEADPSGDPQWSANWTVRINAGKIDGNPVIAGIGLGVDSKTGSNFIIMADRFAFVSPTYTSTSGVQTLKYPFVIGTVGGKTDVGIQGQLMVDGSITADKIKVNSLSALSANMGEVNGGIFRTYRLDANGNVIDPNEFRVEMTNNPSDSWPLWIGSGVKNANNAVFWIDRSGNASFDGTVRASNIADQFQRSVPFHWATDGINDGATDPVTLQAPLRPGETHVAVMTFSVALKNTYNNSKKSAYISIQQLVGSTWTSLSSAYVNLQGADFTSQSFSAISGSLSSATQFRVQISDSEDGAVFMVSVTGYILGLR